MRLSIAMTTYCGAPFVEEQLLSLLTQTRPADEVIIVDDCSQDNTAGIVAAFLKAHNPSNWHFAVNAHNLGYKQNFKQAIGQTTGDVIFLCDQDDVWYADKLEQMEQLFLSRPDCKALSTGFHYIDAMGTSIIVKPQPGMSNHNLLKRVVPVNAVEPIDFAELVSYNITPGCTMAFRAEVKGLYLARTLCGTVHDWELNLVAAMMDGCYFWNRELMKYRIHDRNAVGIPGVGAGAVVDRGGYAHRLSIARQMKEYTGCFQVYLDLLDEQKKTILLTQTAFVEARYQALLAKKVKKLFLLYHHYHHYYCNSVTFKGRLADFVCVLKAKLPAKTERKES